MWRQRVSSLSEWFFTIRHITVKLKNVLSASLNRKGNVLFNDALNTFLFKSIWRRTFGKGPSRNPLTPLHGILFPISSKGSFIPYGIAHTTAFVTPVVEHWLERKIAQWINHEGMIRRPIVP